MTADSSSLYIGLMSGTSMDAVDCALVDFAGGNPVLRDFHLLPLPGDLKARLLQLGGPGPAPADTLGLLGELDIELGRLFAAAVRDILAANGLGATDIAAIGSHGQTVRHRPPRAADDGPAFTLQIGDPNTICELSGITTVADFRRRDMAAGGQGAPLVPAFHREIFQSPERDRAVLNVGGIANVTLLSRDGTARPAWDTGPGNVLMDGWIAENLGKPYDDKGQWAASGRRHEELLAALLDEDYFRLPPPKSTGRELFNAAWLQVRLDSLPRPPAPEDVQATLLELTALSVSRALDGRMRGGELIVCGGGARNTELMERLAAHLPDVHVAPSADYGLHADSVEAVAFAWLAKKTLAGEAVDLCAITGAAHASVLGGIYRA